jgi:HlyD family secretion protein
MRKKLILLGVLVLALIVIGSFYYAYSSKQPTEIQTTGIIEGDEVNLSSKIPGRLAYLCCKEGDSVEKRQVVARLESEDLKAAVDLAQAGIAKAEGQIKVCESMVESARANLQSAQADIKASNSNMEKARIQMELAQKEMDRASALHHEGLISNDEFDVAATKYKGASADYTAAVSSFDSRRSKAAASDAQLHTAENQLTSATADLKQANANLAYDQARLADTEITSPITGTIVFKSLETGETVSPGVTILTIVDMKSLYVRADIEETLIGDIKLGDDVVIKTEGTPPQTFQGKIYEIGRYAEFATQKDVTRGRQDIRTFRIKISVVDNGGALKPGMTVGVEIPKRPHK